ncbi:RNAse P Rpr2/Rpp21/SNM1 subunit domain-containing protein [Irpex lacteus]|nr:RNAse P Rpr2/Rpp21/SNM1 subunit domain-containing protein [Irpex lacteus]
MAKKKSQDDVPNPNSVQNRDIMQRLNFLYQASVLLGTSTQPVPQYEHQSKPSGSQSGAQKISKRQKRKQEMLEQRNPSTAIDLSRTYVRSMKVIGKKTTVRMRRTLCKKCEIVLVPGSTAIVRVNGSGPHGHVVSYTCMACKTPRRIPAPAEPRPAHAAAAGGEGTDKDMAMETDTPAVLPFAPCKKTVTKEPPLFARKDAGHIVFRGNVRVEPQL